MAQPDLSRRTKIVATIGPATESPQRLRDLIQAGATTFRLNFSHGDHSEHAARIATIRQVAHELGIHVGILQDLQGPKIRLGRFEGGPITLANGDPFALTSRPVSCNQSIATITYDRLADEVTAGSRILLDDGRVEMVVKSVDIPEQTLHCTVVVGGVLSNNKGVNFPDVQLSIRALTTKDREDLSFGLQQEVDWVALSFVRNPSDMQEIRELISSQGYSTPVIAKIEKFEAIDQIDAILPLCDGVMVARGDLGVEMPAEEVPLLQKELIRKANTLGIPIITATQMLDSMASCPRPTRAEVSDVANAILDGTDAVMLSNETAVGDYPVEAVETMARIARRIERDYPRRVVDSHMASTIPNAISQAVSTIARQLQAAAILPLTKSGATARNVSKFRPSTTILAITSEVKVARQLQLVWGVNPLLIGHQASTTSTFTLAMGVAQETGTAQGGRSGGSDRRHPLGSERLHRSGQGGHCLRRAGPGPGHRQRLGQRTGAGGHHRRGGGAAGERRDPGGARNQCRLPRCHPQGPRGDRRGGRLRQPCRRDCPAAGGAGDRGCGQRHFGSAPG